MAASNIHQRAMSSSSDDITQIRKLSSYSRAAFWVIHTQVVVAWASVNGAASVVVSSIIIDVEDLYLILVYFSKYSLLIVIRGLRWIP